MGLSNSRVISYKAGNNTWLTAETFSLLTNIAHIETQKVKVVRANQKNDKKTSYRS